MKPYRIEIIYLCSIFLQITVTGDPFPTGEKKEECLKLLKMTEMLNDRYLDRLQELVVNCRNDNVTYDQLVIDELKIFTLPEYAFSLLVYMGKKDYCEYVYSADKLYRYVEDNETYQDAVAVDFEIFGDICTSTIEREWEHYVLADITKTLSSIYRNFVIAQ